MSMVNGENLVFEEVGSKHLIHSIVARRRFEVKSYGINVATIVFQGTSDGTFGKYVFFPSMNTQYDSSFLKEITAFIDKLMDERKKPKNDDSSST